MSDIERRYHETWLGMAQPIEGLVVSVPVLVDAQCMQRLPVNEHHAFVALVGEEKPTLTDVPRFLRETLGYRDTDWVTTFPEDLRLDVVEGQQTVIPTRGLKRQGPPPPKPEGLPDDSTPTSRAGEPFVMLSWELPAGLDFDKKEATTGAWLAEPTVKFERLLRASRVSAGLLFNGVSVRLIYAPHGESTGHLTFRFVDLVSASGRPLFDAMVMLLHARRQFGVLPEHQLPALLEQSRRRQANVTEALAEQVFEALTILLAGFEAAAERDGNRSLNDAFERGEDHVYGGLLTTLLRLVFVLYAEDRGLLPVDQEPYGEDLSVKALYEQLLEDAGRFPDAMSRRYGAWPRLLALFRSIFFGASHGKLAMPPRRGQLFDPESFPFLEGWSAGGAPVTVEAQSVVQPPSIDDDTIYKVLEKLIVLEGQRLSYQSLDVEQIGSVYEALMGFHVKRLSGAGVCLKGSKVWVSADEVLEQSALRRGVWLEEQGALDGKSLKAAGKALESAKKEPDVLAALEPFRVKSIDTRKAGQFVLQPGAERRRTSSHYTPRSLSAPIVRRALEPLLKAMGDLPTSERLLNLKVCDPAMGSGAFLVEACRYLADQVVAAWTREGILKESARDDDIVMRARRLVAQRCLYGVDKNPWAVNLAKLSLWLVTLAKAEPFTFLDHALKCGDSLVGLDVDQIRAFHWNTEKQKQLDLAQEVFKRAMAVALEKRQAILQLALDLERPAGKAPPKQLKLDPARQKEELLREADEALAPVKRIANACVGAFFAADSDKAREQERVRRQDMLGIWLSKSEDGVAPPVPQNVRALSSPAYCFHWPLEFPEVFHGKRPDPLEADQTNKAAWMDSFVGNPPFVTGREISRNSGDDYLAWLLAAFEGANGNADLSAYFFLRAFHLLGLHGSIGLIATNTIAQGDTRLAGLKFIVDRGGQIFDAVRSMKWPVPGANVAVSVVHLAKGHVSEMPLDPRLDGRRVPALNSHLRGKPERADPVPLAASSGRSFQGSIVLGMGFVLTPEQRKELIAKNKKNAERIFRYVGGEEINSDPAPILERYIISFGQMELDEAERWPDLLRVLRELVKPERERQKTAKGYPWWRFWRPRDELYEALRPLNRCLANSQVSKHLVFDWRPTDAVFSHTTYAYPLEEERWLAVLHSRVHEVWARLLSSSMRTDLRYTPSDCFETFPFPEAQSFAKLDSVGERLDTDRRTYLLKHAVGLTTTYNRLKDASVQDTEVQALRALHEEVDRAVLAAYGWSDIPVPPYCGATPAQFEAFEDEVLDRLFDLNALRAEAEKLLAAQSAPAKKATRKKKV